MGRHYAKPDSRPVLNRGRSLVRGCLFAMAPGWHKGVQNPDIVEEDNIRRKKGQAQGSIGGIYGVNNMGRFMGSGTSNDAILWTDPNNYYDIIAAISVAVLFNFDTAPPGADITLFARRNRTRNGSGWSMNITSAPRIRATWENGATEQVLTQSGFLTAGPNPFFFVWTHPGGTSGTSRLWVDGKIDNTVAVTRAVGNNNEPVAMFNSSSVGDSDLDANIGMAAFWKRELTRSEIAQLSSDPYIMWKRTPTIEAGLAAVPGGGGVGIGKDCCKWIQEPFGWVANTIR